MEPFCSSYPDYLNSSKQDSLIMVVLCKDKHS